MRAVVEGKGGFSNFLLQREGELVWDHNILRGWLKDYAELQRLLLVRAEMLSGAPTRGTELTSMSYRNTQTRPTRNLVICGQHVTLLCQYSKTSALTGQDKLIPHSLDAVTSDIFIQDLVLARPFAQIAAKFCFEDNAITQLYRDQLFVNFNKMFTSEDLSAVMARFSLPRIHFALTINPWRHIQTAWRRKFKCSIEVGEEDERGDVEALQAGHTQETENRIYGLSTESLAGAAEDVLPLFLQASTSWQRNCKVIPGGNCLPYNQARSKDENTNEMPTRLRHDWSTKHAVLSSVQMNEIACKVELHLQPTLEKIMQSITDIRSHLARSSSPTHAHIVSMPLPFNNCDSPSLSNEDKGKQRQSELPLDNDIYYHDSENHGSLDLKEEEVQKAIIASRQVISSEGKSIANINQPTSLTKELSKDQQQAASTWLVDQLCCPPTWQRYARARQTLH